MSKYARRDEKKKALQAKLATDLRDLQEQLSQSTLLVTALRNTNVRLERDNDVLRAENEQQTRLRDEWRALARRESSESTTTSAVRAARARALDAAQKVFELAVAAENARQQASAAELNVAALNEQVLASTRRESVLVQQRDEVC